MRAHPPVRSADPRAETYRRRSPTIGDWLPGSTLAAPAEGGNATTPFGTALGFGAVYAIGALIIALVVSSRRDVTD